MTRGIGGHTKPIKGATDTWLTPPHIIKALGPFDLDPCGFRGYHVAAEHYYEKGLLRPWHGFVWLNPPYSEVGDWLDRLADHGNGIALVFARTETKWFQRIAPQATSVFFPAGRFTFMRSDFTMPAGNSGGPSCLMSFGEKPNWEKSMKGWVAK